MQIIAPNYRKMSPHTLPPPACLNSNIPPTAAAKHCWLLGIVVNQRPPKARARRITLFFNAALFGAPNKATNYG